MLSIWVDLFIAHSIAAVNPWAAIQFTEAFGRIVGMVRMRGLSQVETTGR
jgi:hypothetical protein